MQQPLAGAAQRVDQHGRGKRVAGVGGVEHGVGGARGAVEDLELLQRANDRGDAAFDEQGGAFIVARQPGYRMAGGQQFRRNAAADIAGCTGEENFHSAQRSKYRMSCATALAGLTGNLRLLILMAPVPAGVPRHCMAVPPDGPSARRRSARRRIAWPPTGCAR